MMVIDAEREDNGAAKINAAALVCAKSHFKCKTAANKSMVIMKRL
jgi:hypothetical protein